MTAPDARKLAEEVLADHARFLDDYLTVMGPLDPDEGDVFRSGYTADAVKLAREVTALTAGMAVLVKAGNKVRHQHCDPDFAEDADRYKAMLAWDDAIATLPASVTAHLAEVERLRQAVAEAQQIVADCNNSLFGSHSYFTQASGKTAAQAIEELKAHNGTEWRRAEAATSALAEITRLKALELPEGCVAVCEQCLNNAGEAVSCFEHCGNGDCPLRRAGGGEAGTP